MAREVKLITPLGDDVLRFSRMSGSEQIGRLFNYELTAFSTDEEIAVDDILGQNVSVQLEVETGETRFFNGYVSQFLQSGRSTGGFAIYQATLSPWFWFLNCTADCRIFQMMTVPDIIKEVFNENGFNDYEDALTGSYAPREYCVQYRESDFNFVSRLMEKEGIYYYFRHEEGKHHLVLADAYSSHAPLKGNASLPYFLPDRNASVEKDHISGWVVNARVQPGNVALADYNFKTPQNKLRVNRLIQRNHAQATFEVFDYPGLYQESGVGDQYALHRIEELHAGFEQVSAKTDVRQMAAGGVFTLTEHPRSDQNREYLVIGTQHTLEVNEYATGDANPALTYNCDFSAIPSQTPFRSQCLTRKPKVYGPHTAVVVGPAGEEIYPDEFGRVKVQFHWDRYGGADENSSCWVRVSQGWAGAGWGMMQLPRIGQEVIVDFAEGDPDRPIVTGRLYNADNMPPYALPANKTQSGIKSRSSPGGGAGNFNEIRMEDRTGSEELYIQAEKDENILVKNNKSENVGVDETTSIGNNQTLTVGNDQTETIGNNQTESVGNDHSETIGNNQTISVGNDQTESVGNNRTETVGSNETLSVGADRTRSVGSNESITVGSNRMHTVAINETIAVGAAQQIAVGGLQVIAVGAAQTITVGAAQSIDVGINQSIGVGVNQSIDVGSNRSVSVGANNTTKVSDNDTLKAGKNVVIDAGDAITLKCGQASIAMKKDGTIVIQGKNITIKGSGKMDVTASKNITMKGKKILQN